MVFVCWGFFLGVCVCFSFGDFFFGGLFLGFFFVGSVLFLFLVANHVTANMCLDLRDSYEVQLLS